MSSSRSPAKGLRDALSVVRRYVRFGARSVNEVRVYLKRRGISEPLARQAIAESLREGALDDRVCAKLWAIRFSDDGFAWAAIRAKLRDKGFEEPLIHATVRPLQQDADDATRAATLVSHRYRGHRRPCAPHRVARWLASRGYDADLIEHILATTAYSDLTSATD